MENIRQAIERAKKQQDAGAQRAPAVQPDITARGSEFGTALDSGDATAQGSRSGAQLYESVLNSAYLKSQRIVSHIVADPFSRPFDMLRTQILQSMDAAKNSRVLAVTSPMPGCGKTVTAVNLALSIARQPERSALLMDLDFQRPKVATCLGLEFGSGVLGVLEGRTKLSEAIIHARIGSQQLMVLPTTATTGSAELMASRAMATMFQDLRRDYGSQTIIVDLPPILTSDDVIAILPQIDRVLLVVAVGMTKVSEIEECTRHLQSTDGARIVVNKVPGAGTNYFGY
jgi:protein-tyrosine kinase